MRTTTLFLAGDVMTGRGLDQALPHPGSPTLHEPEVEDARRYVALAEAAHGPIDAPLAPADPWGVALAELAARRPALRIVNLETSITTSDDPCRGKQVLYRMHPANVDCLSAAGIDVATLANNHTLDWGRAGLVETLEVLARAGIRTAGAGRDPPAARQPAVIAVPGGGRVLVFAVGSGTSGIPADWQAAPGRPGIDLVREFDAATADAIVDRVCALKQAGDIAVLSIHWGSNWGFHVPAAFRGFAHRLVAGGVDVVHGHSSHHVRPIEVHRDRLILYGCGDFIDDYEGIGGRERYRADLRLMYFPSCDASSGRLTALAIVPLHARRFRLERADAEATRWLAETLTKTSRPFGCSVAVEAAGGLSLRW